MASENSIMLSPTASSHPDELSQNWRSFSFSDWIFTGFMAFVWILLSQKFNNIVGLLIPVVWYLLMIRRRYSRVYFSFYEAWQSLWITLHKDVVWERGKAPTRARLARRLRRSSNRFLVRLGRALNPYPAIPLSVLNFDDWIGVIHNYVDKTDTVVIECDGHPSASWGLLRQYESNRLLAEAIKKIASVQGGSIGVSFPYSRGPANVWRIISSLSRILHPGVVSPKIPEDGEKLTDSQLRQLRIHKVIWGAIDDQELHGSNPRMTMVLTIKRDRKLSASEAAGNMTEDEARHATVVEVVETALAELELWGAANPRVLSRDEVKMFLRSAWDCVGLPELYKQMAVGEPETEERAALSTWHFPQRRIVAKRNYCVMDGNYIAVLRIESCPPSMEQNDPHSLHGMAVPWMWMTLIGEAVSSTKELSYQKRALPIRDSFLTRWGDREDPESQYKDQSVVSLREKIWRSRFRQDFMPLVKVSASNLRELEDHVREATREIQLAGMTSERVTGKCRQVRAVISAAGQHMM